MHEGERYKFVGDKPEKKRSLARHRHKWKDDFKQDVSCGLYSLVWGWEQVSVCCGKIMKP